MAETPRIPGYRIIRLLGQGGMADVYEAVQETLDRKVAIKVIIPELFRDASFAARFVKEAQTAARLSHPHVLHIYDVGAAANCHYIVMQCLLDTLKDRLKNGPLAPDEALRVLRQMGEALDYAHLKGFIHRDIKPDNIMFREDGAAVLTDFGIAKAVDSKTRLTRTGMSVGTPHYMSPEQIRGFDLDGRADFYSLGIVFYEMLTGRVPYEATDTIAVCMKHVQEPLPVLPAHLSRFQPLLEKLLSKEPGQRLGSGGAIDPLLEAKPMPPPQPRPEPIRRVAAAPKPEAAISSPRHQESPVSNGPRIVTVSSKKHLVPLLAVVLAVLVALLLSVLGKNEPESTVFSSDVHMKAPKEPVFSSEVYPSREAMGKKTVDVSDKQGGTTMPPAETKKLKPVPTYPVETPPAREKPVVRELPRIGLLDLDPGRTQEYADRLQRVIVASPPSGVNAYGQISLLVSVNGKGRMSVMELDDQGLTVEPSGSVTQVRAVIRRALAGVSLPPPRDRSLNPAVLGSWRLSFKVASFGGKWILSKQ